MSNYEEKKQSKNENAFRESQNEERELLKKALSEALSLKIRRIEEKIKNMEIPPYSKRHKIRMNRLFHELVGGSFLPFPEEDMG